MIKARWHELSEKTAELSLRERAILVSLTLVVILVIWLQFVFTPFEKKSDELAKKKQALDLQVQEQSAQVATLAQSLQHNPNDALRVEQTKLQGTLEQLREQIENQLDTLVPPEKMADIMKAILSDYKGLRLVSARNLPVEPMVLGGNTDQSTQGEQDSAAQAVIFSHGFEMILEGEYFQTLEFVQGLEAMSGFYWRMLDYKVDTYPKGVITIQISTLSLEEEWIGV